MADDWIARGIAAAALILSGANTWFAYRKHLREEEGREPHIICNVTAETSRRIAVDVEIKNTLNRPILLSHMELLNQPNMAFEGAKRGEPRRGAPIEEICRSGLSKMPHARTEIAIGDTTKWEGAIFLSDAMAAPYKGQITILVHMDLRERSGRSRSFRFKKSL